MGQQEAKSMLPVRGALASINDYIALLIGRSLYSFYQFVFKSKGDSYRFL
jgi:hypothetical protein